MQSRINNKEDIIKAIKSKKRDIFLNPSKSELKEMMSFREDGLNIFLYACKENAGRSVAKAIAKSALKYFSKQSKKASKNNNDNTMMEKDFFSSIVITDDVEWNAITFAIKNSDNNLLLYLQETLSISMPYADVLGTQEKREKKFKELADQHGKRHATYFSSKADDIIQRPPRSFNGEREKQLLKQMATVVFFYIAKHNNTKLTEIEAMHLRIGEVSHLVISWNSGDRVGSALDQLKSGEDVIKMLADQINVKGDLEGKNRVNRYPPAPGKLSPLISINFRGRERSPYETGQQIFRKSEIRYLS